MRKDELIGVLGGLLKDVLKARFAGAERSKLARAHGYADGYMRALLDAQLVDKATLLRAVSESRAEYLDAEDASSGVKDTRHESLGARSAVA
jgi:hypothetical protein